MKKWSKIGLAVSMGAAVLSTAHLINQLIFTTSTSNGYTNKLCRLTYSWKFGDISYTVQGEGSPLLLIHDLSSDSSCYEWTHVTEEFSKNHTVYTIDLLGCGHSDKPNITYTTYLYTELISYFVVNVIKKRTDVIVTGNSAPMIIMSAYMDSFLFDKIILVNPQNIKQALVNPNKYANIRRYILNLPIIGTTIYNIFMNKHQLKQKINNSFNKTNTTDLNEDLFLAYHENAHIKGAAAKYLFTSTQCHYTTANICHALSAIDNSIFIISGQQEHNYETTNAEYLSFNPSIETIIMNYSKHLPQIEESKEFVKQANIFLS